MKKRSEGEEEERKGRSGGEHRWGDRESESRREGGSSGGSCVARGQRTTGVHSTDHVLKEETAWATAVNQMKRPPLPLIPSSWVGSWCLSES